MYVSTYGSFLPEPDTWLYRKDSVNPEHPMGCRWHDQAMGAGRGHTKSQLAYPGAMSSFIGPYNLYPCPTFRRFAEDRGCENPGHLRSIRIVPQNNYCLNAYLGSEREGGVLYPDQLRDPAAVFMFAEENSWTVRPDHPRFPVRNLQAALSTRALDNTILSISATGAAADCFATYHNAPRKDLNLGAGNAVFIDGHVESVAYEDQLRRGMHGGRSRFGPAGNLSLAWASAALPAAGWDSY